MRQLFVSYARENKRHVNELVEHLGRLGYRTWLDSSLHGGQAWWDEILRRIAECDAFVAIVSQETLNSAACEQELQWALALNKPVLPVALEHLVTPLPRELATRKIVDWTEPGADAASELAGALMALPPGPAPPDALPEPPPSPFSYLTGDLVELVSQWAPLTHEQQHEIRLLLGWFARVSVDAEERRSAWELLDTFRRRVDLDTDVYEDLRDLYLLSELRASHATPVPAIDIRALSVACFAPPAVEPGAAFLVQVFAYLPEEARLVASLAREFDELAQRRGTARLESTVSIGERLAFELRIPGLLVDDSVQSMVWIEGPQSVQFGVSVPQDFPPGTVIGTVTISRDSVPIGHLKFKVTVREPGAMPGPVAESAPTHGMHRYRRAFISYASADRNEVLERTQMLAAVRIEFFQDLLTLDPGDLWERRLYDEIDRCDLFLLFWSSAAKKSPWVLKEVHYALMRHAGNELAPPEILPVIIEGPPPVPPPPELAYLHFNDRMIYFIQHRHRHRAR